MDVLALLLDGRACRGLLGLGAARLGEAGLEILGRRWGAAVRQDRTPAPEQRADAKNPDNHGKKALHTADATLPQLLATPVVPSPEAAQGGGADSVHEKEGSGQLNEYEIMLLLDPELAEERANEIVQRVRDSVESSGGTWDGHAPWGRRRMAYEINHKIEAVYHLLLFTSTAETLAEITRVLKITDGVVRHGAFRRVQGGHHHAPSPIPAPSVAAVSAPADDTDADDE